MGYQAGQTNQGNTAIAIGYLAGHEDQHNSSIAINASCDALNPSNPGLYINPIRNCVCNVSNTVYYNSCSKELTYGPASSGYSGFSGYSGATGCSGFSGYSGYSGISSGAPTFCVVTGNVNVTTGTQYFVNACSSVNFFLPNGNTVTTGASVLMVQGGTGCTQVSQYMYNVLSQCSPIVGRTFGNYIPNYWAVALQSPAYAIWTGDGWALTTTIV
jgi:hypothetical protein